MNDISSRCVRVETTNEVWDAARPDNPPNLTRGVGTGFFVCWGTDKKSFGILTCSHVVSTAKQVKIRKSDAGASDTVDAEIKLLCPDFDLAILSVDMDITTDMCFGLSDPYAFKADGEVKTWAPGFPMGSFAVTQGHISAWNKGKIQITTPLNGGNSGGPLLVRDKDNKYRVIGVNSSGYMNKNAIGFAIPIAKYKLLMEPLRSGTSLLPLRVPKFGICTNKGGVNFKGCSIHYVFKNRPIKDIKQGDRLLGFTVHETRINISSDGDVVVPATLKIPNTWILCGQRMQWPDFIDQVPFKCAITVHWAAIDKENKATVKKATIVRTNCLPIGLIQRVYPLEGVPPYCSYAGMIVQPLAPRIMSVSKTISNLYRNLAVTGLSILDKPHLVVTHVSPGTPAIYARSIALGARVVAVNGAPTLDLKSFNQQLTTNSTAKFITVTFESGREFVVDLDNIERKHVCSKR